MNRLSIEQQQTIIDSLWVVNEVLKRQKMAYDEDLRQSAILYLCECLCRFKCEYGVKWTTYAYKNINLFVKRTIDEQREQKSKEIMINREFAVIEKNNESKAIYYEIKQSCNENEKKLLELKLQGYSDREIGEILGWYDKKIWQIKKGIKEKARCLKGEQRANSLY